MLRKGLGHLHRVFFVGHPPGTHEREDARRRVDDSRGARHSARCVLYFEAESDFVRDKRIGEPVTATRSAANSYASALRELLGQGIDDVL